jgi:hypothetical protein
MPVRLYAGTWGGGVYAIQPKEGMLSIYLPLNFKTGD